MVLKAPDMTPGHVVRAASALADLTSPSLEEEILGEDLVPHPPPDTADGTASGLIPWALQLHRALALRAHQCRAEGHFSEEQMMELARDSLRAGYFHSLLFKDVVQMYVPFASASTPGMLLSYSWARSHCHTYIHTHH